MQIDTQTEWDATAHMLGTIQGTNNKKTGYSFHPTNIPSRPQNEMLF